MAGCRGTSAGQEAEARGARRGCARADCRGAILATHPPPLVRGDEAANERAKEGADHRQRDHELLAERVELKVVLEKKERARNLRGGAMHARV